MSHPALATTARATGTINAAANWRRIHAVMRTPTVHYTRSAEPAFRKRTPARSSVPSTKIAAMDRYVPLPPLPARISRLNDLAYDLWWSWNVAAREVFRDLDFPLWRFTDHNPVLLLHLVESERLEYAAQDP